MSNELASAGSLEDVTQENFPEEAYLLAYPDVAVGIAEGIFATGYDHFITSGRQEMKSGSRADFQLVEAEFPLVDSAEPLPIKESRPVSADDRKPSVRTHFEDLICFVDEVSDGMVRGWVKDYPSSTPTLHALVDGQPVASFVSNKPRPDVAEAYAGNMYVGFRFLLPKRVLNGSTRRLEICSASGAPLTLMLNGENSRSITFRDTWTRQILGHVDGFSRGRILGWVLLEDPDEAGALKGNAVVLVTLNGAKVAHLRANLYRPDAGRSHGGAAYCGFEFVPPQRLRARRDQTFSFTVVPEGVEIDGSPITVEILSEKTEAALLSMQSILSEFDVEVTRVRRELAKLVYKKSYNVHTYDDWAREYFSKLTRVVAGRSKSLQRQDSTDAASGLPLISIICPTYRPDLLDFRAAVESVIDQSYRNWELVIVDDGSQDKAVLAYLQEVSSQDARIKVVLQKTNGGISAATNAGLAAASGQWIGFMDHDDLLVDVALEVMLDAAIRTDALVLYSDEDKIDRNGRYLAPAFKPDWNYRLLLGLNYVCHFLVVKREAVDEVGGLNSAFDGAQDHDFLLRLSEHVPGDRIHHVPEVLYHWRITDNSTSSEISNKPYAIKAGVDCVSEHLKRTGKKAIVKNFMNGTFYKVQWQNAQSPKVEIIIPFKDNIETTRECVSRVLDLTQYPNLAVTLVDNWSTAKDLDLFVGSFQDVEGVKIIRVEEEFNYSKLNNLAARKSDAAIYVFMNNDLFVQDRLWLRLLVNEALADSQVGIVGGKFLYPNGSVQHAGVVLGAGGVAGHVHSGIPGDEGGYAGRAFFAQEMSAVTGACMLVKAAVFNKVGGFDELHLPVAFNDVDLCLKVAAAGYRTIWTPDFVAEHHESLSRGSDDRPETRDRFFNENHVMFERWDKLIKNDPFYSKHFDLAGTSFFDLVDPDDVFAEGEL